jgi:hypothetical protein
LYQYRARVLDEIRADWQGLLRNAQMNGGADLGSHLQPRAYGLHTSYDEYLAAFLSEADLDDLQNSLRHLFESSGHRAAFEQLRNALVADGVVPSQTVQAVARQQVANIDAIERLDRWRADLAREAEFRAGSLWSRSIYNTGNQMAVEFQNMQATMSELGNVVLQRRLVLEKIEGFWQEVVGLANGSEPVSRSTIEELDKSLTATLDNILERTPRPAYAQAFADADHVGGLQAIEKMGWGDLDVAAVRQIAERQLQTTRRTLTSTRDTLMRFQALTSTSLPIPSDPGPHPRRGDNLGVYRLRGGFHLQADRYVFFAAAGHEGRRLTLEIDSFISAGVRREYTEQQSTRAGRSSRSNSPLRPTAKSLKVSNRIVDLANVRTGFWGKMIYRPSKIPELIPAIGIVTELGVIWLFVDMMLRSDVHDWSEMGGEGSVTFESIEASFAERSAGKTIAEVETDYRKLDSVVRINVKNFSQASQIQRDYFADIPEFIDAASLVDEVLLLN